MRALIVDDHRLFAEAVRTVLEHSSVTHFVSSIRHGIVEIPRARLAG